MALGNPSGATTDPSKTNNYLIARSQYAMSYNGITHQANWVSWSYSSGDSGGSGRTDAWSEETALPAGYYRVGISTFGSSFGEAWDRGHMCPSADRTSTVADNEMTFRMSNIIPQAAQNNQGLWADFETYSRTLAADGDEILVLCGPSEFTGNRLFNQMAVPASVWKIIVEVPNASSTTPAHQRVTTNSRVIALLTPNTGSGLGTWQSYITSVEEIEAVTGLNFFSNVNPAVATYLKNVVDTGTAPNKPTVITSFTPVSGAAGTTVTISGYNFGTTPTVQFNGVTAVASVSGGTTITATVPAGAGSGPITVSGTGGTDTSASDFTVGSSTQPGLGLSTGNLNTLSSIQGSAGTSQSYTVTGSNLTGDITVTAPTNFEVSLNNSTFAGSQTIGAISGGVSQTVYVRIKSTAPLGSVSGTVTHSGGGAATQNLSVAGTVASNQPSLTLSTTNLTGFSALQGSVSSSKSYTISGVNLTGAITVTAPTNFEISTNNISFVSSLSLTPVGTTLANTVVYARIAASAPLGAASGSISNAGGSAATQTVALSGNVSSGAGSGESWVASSGTNSKGSINTGQSFGNKTGVWINELHYDTTGTDSGEFIEVVVAPDVANALSEISVVLYNGNGGAAYGTLSLTNYTLGSTVNGYRIFYYNYPSNGIQNGGSTTAEPDGIVITVGSAVEEFLSYEGVFTATSGAASGMTSKNIGITETSAAVGSSLQLTGSPSTAVAPSITSTNAVTATNYADFSYQITASNDPVSYNASGLPNGLSINTSNGLISGTNRTTPGIYTIGLSAINSAGEGTKNLTLTLLKNPGAPTITSATNATAYLRSAFGFTATANPAATAWTFAGLPSGLTNSNATISGTPTTTGTFSVAITATNSLGSDSQSLALTVVDPVISLSTNSIAGLSSTVGKEGSVQAYMVSGSNLTSNITVTAPTHFRISEDGVNFTNNPITLIPSQGSLSEKMLFVSLATNAPVGARSGSVTHTGGGALSQNLAVAGTVIQPVLTISTNSLSGFSTRVGVASASQSYTVSGTELAGGITITPPAGFELSTDDTTFSDSLLLIPSAGTLSSTPIFVRISGAASEGALTGNLLHEGGDAVPQSLSLAGSVVMPSLALSVSSLADFSANAGTASASKSYTVSGSHLTGAVTVTAPAGFELSLDNSSYGTSRSLTPSAGVLSAAPVYVRLSSSAPLGVSSGNISHTGGDASTQTLAVTGTVSSANPTLAVTPASLSGFSSTQGVPSGGQPYTLSGSGLTGNVTITAPTGFEVSLDNATFANSRILAPSSGNLSSVSVFVRISATAGAGTLSGAVTHSGGGATTVSVNVDGSVADATPILTLSASSLSGFSALLGEVGTFQTYTVSGVNLKGPVTLSAAGGFEISQDGTNYAGSQLLAPASGTLAATTIRVRLGNSATEGAASGTISHTGGGIVAQTLSLSGTVTGFNGPAITSTRSGSYYTNNAFSHQVTLATTNTNRTFSATGLPSGFTISATGLISGTNPAVSATNLIVITVNVTNEGVSRATYRLRTLTAAEQSAISGTPSVVINKYFNGTPDRVELLVAGDSFEGPPVDLRGMVIKDFGGNMGNDNAGKYVFKDHALWAAVRAGTLIVLSAGTTQSQDFLATGTDYVLRVNLGNTDYFTEEAGGFNIDNTDMLMIKAANTGADGVAGGIHAASMGSAGSQYTAFTGRKLNNGQALGSNRFYAYAVNGSGVLADFYSSSGIDRANFLTFGSQNNSNNGTFINSLRGLDQVAPVVTLNGLAELTIAHGTSYTEPGASASGATSTTPTITGSVNANAVGVYTLTYSASDAAGNVGRAVRTVRVTDQTPPVLTLNGPSVVQVPYGSSYNEPGATATDAVDGDLSAYVQVITPIQTASVGSSQVKSYVVSDFSGNESETLVRTLEIVKATPMITSAPTASAITVGQALGNSVLSGGSASVLGSFAWSSPGTVPSSTGNYEVTFTPTDSTNYNTVTAMVNVTVNSNPLTSWAGNYGLSGTSAEAEADPDGDGWANLAEYAMGGNPTNAAGGLGPTVSTTNTNGTNWLRFAYRARTNDAALVIQPVFKVNLTETNWSTNGVVQKVSGQPAGDGVHEDQVWQTPVGVEARRFLKLNISR